jgi:hypothetical protein
MAVYTFRIGPYARSIYIYGTQQFSGIPAEYHEPVKKYAAENYTQSQLDNALLKAWIDQQEYDETCAYITAPVVLPELSSEM